MQNEQNSDPSRNRGGNQPGGMPQGGTASEGRRQQSDTHAGQMQYDRGLEKQDLKPDAQNQGGQGSAQDGADPDRRQQEQQDAILDRGGADPTGGQVIGQGGGPGEDITPRPGEDIERGPGAGQRLEEGQPASMGQSAEQPAEGGRSEQELTRQKPD